ncbi:MAG: cysteine desulfurase family protein [Alphaproteobacteria bacterium]
MVHAYLDHNATTPVRPEAAAAVAEALARGGNPSSVHRFGRLARRAVEEAREVVAALAGADPAGVVFTAGGTEANNLALTGAGRRRVLVSAVEHASVREARDDAIAIPVDAEGIVRLDALADLLAADPLPALVSVMWANNETGAIQPVADVAALARVHGALFHCDAVQAAGRLPLDMSAAGIDLMTLSAHKLGGPQGAGALVLRDGIEVAGMLRGGGQERGRRAGTENVPAIAGFGMAAALAAGSLADESARLAALRDRLEAEARARVPAATIHAAAAPRLPNTCCIGLPGLRGEVQVVALDLAGVAVSAGAACSSGKVAPSHVLAAMGLDAAAAGEAIRVSLGWTTTDADIDRFLDAWTALAARHGAAPLARNVA